MSITRIDVRYAETDQMGLVHHSVYYVWFELARIEMLRDAGLPYAHLEADGYLLPVLATACRHRRPVRFGERVLVRPTLRLAPPRLYFTYQVEGEDGVLRAEGETAHVFTDPGGRPRNLRRLPFYPLLAAVAGSDEPRRGGADGPDPGAS